MFANTAPELGYKGISCFIVTRDMGVSVAKSEDKVRAPLDAHTRLLTVRAPT